MAGMNNIERVHRLNISEIETLAFAGGGNRCWWQAGVLSKLLDQGFSLPKHLVGTSAGAAIAASCLLDGPEAALQSCLQLFANNPSIIARSELTRLKFRFAHDYIYPAWISSIVHVANFQRLNTAPSHLQVAITRPARALGLTGSVMAGTLAYILDKHIWHSIHPQLPKYFGLRQDFHELRQCQSAEHAQLILTAAAAAPPFMSACRIGDEAAIDGGYVDNAPIHEQTFDEKIKTLVLLTRNYPKLPKLFRWNDRFYWQPSTRVPVSTWDCTARATVHAAYALGRKDAWHSLQEGIFFGV